MLLLFISMLLAVAYLLWGVAMLNGLHIYARNQTAKPAGSEAGISIVIALRNEEENLPQLLNSIEKLVYPSHLVEVVFVDDFSEDNSISLIKSWMLTSPYPSKCLENLPASMGKKGAQAIGVENASHHIIACTDADCILPSAWLRAINNAFLQESVVLVFGPVSFVGTDHLMQRIEFNALIASTMAMLKLNWPVMGNGANMAFRRDAYLAEQDKLSAINSPSGDDVFLLHGIAQSGGAIDTLKPDLALVRTNPQAGFMDLFQQRLRWASKAKYYRSPVPILVGMLVFGINAMILYLAIFALISLNSALLLAFVFGVKSIFDFMILRKYTKLIHEPFSILTFLMQEIINIGYVPTVAILSQVLPYSWKNRKH
jgi:biofilm PGA synthesis N-glycosyltransferase PgaC